MKGYQDERTERLDRDIEYLTKELELNGYQADELRGVFESQYERDRELTALWEAGTPDEELGRMKEENGERFSEELGGVLTPDQVERFWGVVARGGRDK